MSEPFNAYHKWLAIPPEDQPPNHYRLLGTALFESDADVISHAADQRMAHLRSLQTGKHADMTQKILGEIAQAKICLLDETKKAAYDNELKAQRQPRSNLAKAKPLPTVAPASGNSESSPSIAISTTPSATAWRAHVQRHKSTLPVIVAGAVMGVVVIAGIVIAVNLGGSNDDKMSAELPPENQPDSRLPVDEPTKPNHDPPPASRDASNQTTDPALSAAPISPTVEQSATTDDANTVVNVTGEPSTPRSDDQDPAPVAGPAQVDAGVPDQAAKKLPVPDSDTQNEIREKFKDLFKSEIASAKSSKDKLELAELLLQRGKDTTGDNNARYVLFHLAVTMAVNIGDVDVAMSAIGEMAATYDIDAWNMRIDAMTDIGKIRGADFKQRGERLAGVARSLLENALAAGEFEPVDELYASALSAARKSTNLALVKELVAQKKTIDEIVSAHAAAKQALDRLVADPDDPEANLLVGRFLCLVKNDWDAGLLHLAKSNDANWTAVAEREAAVPSNVELQIELGDAWWTLAESAIVSEKSAMQQRAAFWYREALPASQGIVKAKLEQRLSETVSHGSSNPKTPETPKSGDSDAAYWKVTYTTGWVRYYEIDVNGNIFFTAEGKQSRLERLSDGSFRVEFGDGKLERLKLDGQLLRVEHFDPASNFPDRVSLTGVGQKLPALDSTGKRPSGKVINLLDYVDPSRDAVRQSWERNNKEIRSSGADRALLMIPVEIEGNYEVTVTFTRNTGGDIVAVVLPAADRQCGYFLAADGHAAGLGLIDGQAIGENGTQRSSLPLTNGKRYVLKCRVMIRQNTAAITASLDGMALLDWRGNVASLSLGPNQALPLRRHLGLYTHVSSTTFHSVVVKLLD
jgi:hypothetical protein